ncbi:MAG TPA: sterol desaturase family protein [Caulobacteraceae bacterium]|nr:sterol desaturase family protein [Caulobacteraceae bacterium]
MYSVDLAQISTPISDRTSNGATARVLTMLAVYLAVTLLAGLAIDLWAPNRLSLHLTGHSLVVSDLHQHIVRRGLEVLVLFPALFLVETALTGWRDSSLRHLIVQCSPSTRSDIACWVLTKTGAMHFMILGFSLGVALISGVWIHDRIAAFAGGMPSVATWPLWAQLPLLYLVYSFFDYWNHRLDHSNLFWPLHRFHHAADDFCILTAGRVHPALFTGIVSVVPAVALGAAPDALIDLAILISIQRQVIHSRIDSNFGWIGRWVFQSPVHHRLHHVLDISVQPVGHFSLAPIWDHLFGTWRGEADQTLPIGVAAPYRHGAWLWPDLWRDYCDFWRRCWRLVTRQPRLPEPTSIPS